jgi:hypothetical protein
MPGGVESLRMESHRKWFLTQNWNHSEWKDSEWKDIEWKDSEWKDVENF